MRHRSPADPATEIENMHSARNACAARKLFGKWVEDGCLEGEAFSFPIVVTHDVGGRGSFRHAQKYIAARILGVDVQSAGAQASL